MPVLFFGHGSPMNAIEDNQFSSGWKIVGETIPEPSAVLCISAHWETRGTCVTAMEKPKTIHDFGGFPRELYEVQYPAPGSPEIASKVKSMIRKTEVGLDQSWGLDHGYDWAMTTSRRMKEMIMSGDYRALIDYRNQGREFQLAVPTPEHFLPLLYVLALKDENEKISFFNDVPFLGSLTMTSVKIS